MSRNSAAGESRTDARRSMGSAEPAFVDNRNDAILRKRAYLRARA